MAARDVKYYARRREKELATAQRAASPETAAIHLQLAEAYRSKIERLTLQAGLRVEQDAAQ